MSNSQTETSTVDLSEEVAKAATIADLMKLPANQITNEQLILLRDHLRERYEAWSSAFADSQRTGKRPKRSDGAGEKAVGRINLDDLEIDL